VDVPAEVGDGVPVDAVATVDTDAGVAAGCAGVGAAVVAAEV
jgi:hypothetical protein